ncbi:MAG TPA: HAMP domain-containing sensor histidine kinase [Gemmatimonadaceae bacterium]|nr:HAMP domain-containing sensor histidine kinase [Gemmatimonadaceae bacterium]
MIPHAGATGRRDDDDRERPRALSTDDVEVPLGEQPGVEPSASEREREALRAAAREAHERALAAARAKSEFLATMSHEMRTPLNAVLGYTDLLALGVPGTLNEEQRGYLDRIRGASSRLLALINDVLDLAKIDAGRLVVSHERGSAGTVVASAIELVAPLAEARGVRVLSRCTADAEFIGDRKRVEQIVHQLLSNAVRFSSRGDTVTVTCTRFETPVAEAADRAHGCWCAVRVEDAGVGIEDGHHSTIFEPFTQVDSSHTRVENGTGLGLALARRLARLMGGDLTVTSRLGAGSAFTIWIPSPPRLDGSGEADGCTIPERRGGERRASGLADFAHAIAGQVDALVARFVERMRGDPRIVAAAETDQRTLEDHTAAFVADLAQALAVIGTAEGEPQQIMRDSAEIQLLIANRHGALRQRGGWTEEEIDREYDLLSETISETVQSSGTEIPEEALSAGRALVDRFIARAREEGRRAYRRSALGVATD